MLQGQEILLHVPVGAKVRTKAQISPCTDTQQRGTSEGALS